MRSFIFLIVSLLGLIFFQEGRAQSTVNDLPKFIPPAPEASALLKADNLSVGYTTGAANINIPLYSLQSGGYSLPISLNYSSTGIKVDEIASMVGTGWTLNCGGVVSRTVMDIPDELRNTSNCNLNTHNFSSPDYDLIQYLGNANADKQSDIFSFSFGGYSGKFILGLNNQPVQLSKANIKIQIINGLFLDGFIITTDDGTEYRFQEVETSLSRNSSGTGCKNDDLDMEDIKTSWFLTKIILPSRQKEINFTYVGSTTTFSPSISQTLSLVVSSENYQCSSGQGPTGAACPVNSITYSSCTSLQTVSTKFISQIVTSEGDKIDFFYDLTGRTDLVGGLRLNKLKVTNREGLAIKNIIFNGSYQIAVNANSTFESYRLFLESIKIRNGLNSSTDEQAYYFEYNDYANLPRRLSFAQDMYGYYNGKTSNASLLPVLSSGNVNYSTFNNGTGYGSYAFGDRSIDTSYAKKGLLNKITYPTGGFDVIEYRANRQLNTLNNPDTEDLCGGNSVSNIKSYTGVGSLADEKEFSYRYFSDGSLSTFLITDNIIFSFQNNVQKDGYECQNSGVTTFVGCAGPTCLMATVTSNINNPITTYGSQHVYHRAVQEKNINGSQDLGFIEHKYDYFMAGSLAPNNLLGHTVLNASYHIIPDIFIGETETNYYKNTGQSPVYQIVKKVENDYENDGFGHYSSYAVKKKYNSVCVAGPGNTPLSSEVGQFDVDEIYVYTNTSKLQSSTVKDYGPNSQLLTKLTTYEYGNSNYTYPTRITDVASDGVPVIIERKYPLDYSLTSMNNRNIINPVIEEKYFKGAVLQTTKTQTYSDWFSNGDILVPQNIEVKIGTNSLSNKVVFHSYDTKGNVLDVSKQDDVSNSYIWGYNYQYPIAQVINASATNIAYSSFETTDKGNWTYSGIQFTDALVPTGRKVYDIATGQISKSGLTSTTTYTVSYWTKNTSAFSINGTIANYPIQGSVINGWRYFEHKITGQTQIAIIGSGLIDELRLYPDKALMTTMTYDPLIGITAQCDANNGISYYEYDDFNRLFLVRDKDRKVTKKNCYNYHNMPEYCTANYNGLQSMQFQRQCSSGYTGSYVTYSIPAGVYLSSTGVTEANQKAIDDLLANGQAYANAIGTCTPVSNCNSSNCTGANKKCVNGICQTGIKVYTSSVWIAFHMYECTYHYEWSDGSWSQNYTEISPTPCFSEM